MCQGDSPPTRKVHSNRKARQVRKEIPYIHKKLPERNHGAGRNILIQVLPACRRTSTLARCAASGGRGPGGRNLMDHCDLCDLCGERFGITGGARCQGSGVGEIRAKTASLPGSLQDLIPHQQSPGS